jgi:hypothetical protein
LYSRTVITIQSSRTSLLDIANLTSRSKQNANKARGETRGEVIFVLIAKVICHVRNEAKIWYNCFTSPILKNKKEGRKHWKRTSNKRILYYWALFEKPFFMMARVYKGAQNHQRKKLSVREKTSHVQEKESRFNECKRRRQHTIGK